MAKQKLKKKAIKKKLVSTSKKIDKVEKEDKFLNEDSTVIVEDAYVAHPGEDVVRDVVYDLPGYQDWARESRGNGLTFGDY
jgi:hypothetical protein